MLHSLLLFLPALIPSWRFFDWIAPSPRIEIAGCQADGKLTADWREFRPRPAHLSMGQMIGRLVWNPEGNESLFLLSCAERLLELPTPHQQAPIIDRIRDALQREPVQNHSHFRFRLRLIQRRGDVQVSRIAFESPLFSIHEGQA